MKALVTGGAGFIGSHLIDALLKKDYDVACIDNFSSGKMEFIEHNLDKIELIKGDLLNRDDIKKALKSVDIVFHLVYLFNFNIFSSCSFQQLRQT